MFRAEQLTDGDRQRRLAPRSHAVTIRQAAAAAGENYRGARKAGGNAPLLSEMQEKLQEKSFPCVLHTIIPT